MGDAQPLPLVAKVSRAGDGLSNQLFAVINSVFVAQRGCHSTIAVGALRTDFGPTGSAIPAGAVIDLPHLNSFLGPAYGITMQDAVTEDGAQHTFGWIDAVDALAFRTILTHIRFRADPATPPSEAPCNVMHLRMEPDALQHWGCVNHMTPVDFEAVLAAKYIGLVDKYLDVSVPVLVVTDVDVGCNPVMQHMRDAGYTVRTVGGKEDESGRELRAVQDCVAAIACRGDTLVGAFNLANLNGSTFSYVLWQLGACARAVMLDPDHIGTPEQVTER
jgi:hypothetical protein